MIAVTWPVREGRDYYGGLLADPACLLAVARTGDDGRVVSAFAANTGAQRLYQRHGFTR